MFSYVINKVIVSNYNTLGVELKNDTAFRWSSVSKPSLGGFSMYITFLASTAFYVFMDSSETNVFLNGEFLGLFVAAFFAFLMGAADDYYNTKPLLKLGVQIGCGLIFMLTGNSIDVFHDYVWDGLLTIVWVVAVMNSLNMLDNMDGITATVSLMILGAALTVLLMTGVYANIHWAILIIAQMGALIGFLFFNINPSKMFMGDGGSQFLALFVSFFGIKAFWNLPAAFELPSWSAAFLVMVAFTPAVVDTLTVMINRKRRGVSVMLGGKDHTTHHLVYRGLTDFQVWIVFAILSIASFGFVVTLAYLLSIGYYYLSALGLFFFLMVFIPLYRNTLKYPDPKG